MDWSKAIQTHGKHVCRPHLIASQPSMSHAIISVENLSKCYLIGHQSAQSAGNNSIRDALNRGVSTFARKAWDMARGKQIVQGDEVEEFWALSDVSFEVQVGEVVGIIGRNGAGKSTLLKVLSRITEPTLGRVRLRGRVASLLEVGTGFHPELSGRENIYLNGAILGMSKSEIKRKFDEIVSFAEVSRFLDTPVKRYSSGMYVRLAFAVAAHLEPEILVVDEVLAVGDLEFQRKCMGKMQDVAAHGRTVLFVSHNLAAIQQLCSKSVYLNAGKVKRVGTTAECVQEYMDRNSECGKILDHTTQSHPSVRVDRIAVNESELDEFNLQLGERDLVVEMSGVVLSEIRGGLQVRLFDQMNTPLGIFSPAFEKGSADLLAAGNFTLKHTMRLPRLNRGQYSLMFELVLPNVMAWYEARDAVRLNVNGTPMATGQVFDVSQSLGWQLMEEV